jgi:putative membrane protein
MWFDAFLAMVHHLAVFSLFAILAAEATLLSAPLSTGRLQVLGRVDGLYGLAAAIALTAGGLRAVYGAKGWDFYSANPVFWSKLGLFVVIGLISIVPTVRIIGWRKTSTPVADGARLATRKLVVVQLVALFALPMLAALMARGIGFPT